MQSLTPEVIQLIAQLPYFVLGAFVIVFAIWKLAPLAQQQTAAYNRLAGALESMQKASSATEKAIGGLAETQSVNGAGQAKALDLIAQSLNTAMARQQQYGDVTMEVKSNTVQALASILAVGGQIGGMEEMVGEVLRKVLDMNDALKLLVERPAPITATDLNPLSTKLHEVEVQLLKAIEQKPASSEPLVVKVPQGTVAVDLQVEKKEETPTP